MTEDKNRTNISELLKLGTAAKTKQYHTMLSRISKGESLTSSELKAFDVLERELRALDEGSEKHTVSGPSLPNILAVVEYLERLGWKIKKSAAYKHRSEGKLRPTQTGTYLITEVDRYATTHLRKLDGTTRTGLTTNPQDNDDIQANKMALEVRHLSAKVSHQELKNDILLGKFVPKDLFERELAARAAVFKTDIENFARSQASGIIALVAGDLKKISELIDFILSQGETWLARYTESQEFTVSPEDYERILAHATTEDDEDTDTDKYDHTHLVEYSNDKEYL
jgi:hypothetical protein